MGTQTVTINKVAQLLERINPETCTNVIAIKDGTQPLVYLMAVPFNLRERLQNLMQLGCIKNETVMVTDEDYGEVVLPSAPVAPTPSPDDATNEERN